MASIEHLFVYGTLCRQTDGALHPLLGKDAEYVCNGHLPGRLYEIDGYPGALLLSAPASSIIHGELYRLLNPQSLLQRIDVYEECAAHFPQPHEYRRAVVKVDSDGGKSIQAWIYLYNHPLAGRRMIASGDYRRFRQQGHHS